MTESIATILAALGIASLVLALITMASGRHRPALAFAAAGLAAISLVTVWRAFLLPHVADLKQIIVQRDREIETLKGLLNTSKLELSKSQTSHRQTAGNWTTGLMSLSERLRRLDLTAAEPPSFTLDGDAELQSALLTKAMAATAVPPYGSLPADIMARVTLLLEARFRGTLSRPEYFIEAKPDAHTVDGSRGTYYTIRPLDPKTGQPFEFLAGKDNVGDAEEQLRDAIEKIGADLLRDIGRAVKHDVYAIGNADAVRCQPDCGDVPSREVMQILKLGTKGRYDPASKDPEFGKKVRNNDLPNLRADRVASVLSGFLNGEPVLILENGASEAKGSKFRTAEIVLFVPW